MPLQHTRHFTGEGCIVGAQAVSYQELIERFVCRHCGGRPVHHMRWNEELQDTEHWAACGARGAQDFIQVWLYDKQVADYPMIIYNLPAHLRALLPGAAPTVATAEQAISELYDL